MDRVPEDILLDILSRLSFVSVLKCRLVSKSWRAVTSDLTFIGLHFARSRRRDPTLLLDVGTEFYMTEPKEDDDPVNPYDSFALRIPGEEQSVIPYRRLKDAACKGFLPNNTPCNPYTRLRSPDPTQPYRTSVGLPCMGFLLEIRSLYDFGAKLHMRIRNPWTGQVFVLPTYVKRLRRLRGRIDGFGFDPDIGEYKVLIIEYGRDEPVLHGSICSISRRGAVGSWRMIEMLVPFDMQAGSEQGTFFNGEIHWLVWRRIYFDEIGGHRFSHMERCMITFSVGRERFTGTTMALPDELFEVYVYLLVLCGSLSIVAHREDCLEIWVMKEYGNDKSWMKEYVVPWHVKTSSNVVCICKNGEILLNSFGQSMFYNPKTRTFRDCVIPGQPLPDWSYIVPFVGCFHVLG